MKKMIRIMMNSIRTELWHLVPLLAGKGYRSGPAIKGGADDADGQRIAPKPKNGLESNSRPDMVARTGFEPLISALRGRCPGPLDERATAYRQA